LRGKLETCAGDIRQICDNNGLRHEIITTKSISDLREKVTRYAAHRDAVYYAAGGDGSFQALVNAVDLNSCTIQYLPFGSGNNAYRTFYNQAFDLKRDILSTGVFKADLGQANGEYVVTMFGLALDARIGANVGKFRKWPLSGKGKYYASILYTLLFQSKPVDVEMTVDGERREISSSFISITNGPTIGGQTPISPDSSAFDGKLNAVIADSLSFAQVLKLFSKINTGEHLKDPHVSKYLFEELVFTSGDTLTFEIDGEIRRGNRIEVKACKDIITLKGKTL
jgi:diacylglycerol kinase family enzyme